MTFKTLAVIAITSSLAVAQTAPPAQPAKPAPAPTAAKPAATAAPAATPAKPAATAAPAATPAKPAAAAAAKPAAPKPAVPSPVDNVIELVQAKMSESFIITSIRNQNKPMSLAPADLVKLQKAGVSENIIAVMMNPAAAVAPAQAAAPAPAPAPVAVAPAAAPEPAPAPVAAAPAATPVAANAAPTQAEKKRVIVDEFDYAAVKTQVQAVFNTQQNIGKGIRAMLVKRIADQNKLVVVERAKMDTLIKEQDFNTSNRTKQGTGARVGRIAGADALLAGDIVAFGRDDRKTKVRGGGIFGSAIAGAAGALSTDKAVIIIDYRLIDAETSEVIATGEARGESVRKSKGFGAIAGAFGKGVAGVEVDMTSSNFAETIIGEATMDAVNKLAAILSEQSTSMKKTVREVEALVADVNGGVLTLSAGANDGISVGETFEIFKVLREVKDPVTKEVLDRITEKTGEMKISNVRDRVASGTYAGSPVQAGFVARKKIQ